jgi:hypothetical protein
VVITSKLLPVFTVIDTLAEVKLQYFLHLTILHIVQAHEIILTSVAGKNIQKIVPVFKLEFALGIASTKQRFSSEYGDSDLFLTLLVPIQLSTSSSLE